MEIIKTIYDSSFINNLNSTCCLKNNSLTFEKYNSGHTINQRNLLSLIEWLNKTDI